MYNYPIDIDWTNEELMKVMDLYVAVEKAYEEGIKSEVLQNAYQRFIEVVSSKAMQKQYDKAFEKESGYSIYRAYQESLKKDFVKL